MCISGVALIVFIFAVIRSPNPEAYDAAAFESYLSPNTLILASWACSF